MLVPIMCGIVGGAIGFVLFWGVVLTIDRFRDNREHKKNLKRQKEDESFLENLSRKGTSGTIVVGRHTAIYSSDGDLVWDSVRGCVGLATYIP